MSTTRIQKLTIFPISLLLLALPACKNEDQKAQDLVHKEAEDVRKQIGEVGKETSKLGKEVRELNQADRTAWQQAAKSEGYLVDFAPGGVVIAYQKEAPSVSPTPHPPPPADAELESAVKNRLSQSSSPSVKDVNVTAQSGVATLRGRVPTIKEATIAVESALKTPGVIKVVSHLDYGA